TLPRGHGMRPLRSSGDGGAGQDLRQRMQAVHVHEGDVAGRRPRFAQIHALRNRSAGRHPRPRRPRTAAHVRSDRGRDIAQRGVSEMRAAAGIVLALISAFFIFYTCRLLYVTRFMTAVRASGHGAYVGLVVFPLIAIAAGWAAWRLLRSR